MGEIKDSTEEIAEQLSKSLGLETEEKKEEQEESEESQEKKEETESKESSEKETENNTKTITLTEEQLEIEKAVSKLDDELDTLKSSTGVDTDEFYENLDEHLSEEEQQLEFDDKKAYLKVVETKKAEFIKNHSNEEKIAAKEKEKKELLEVNERINAISVTTQKYKDYNHQEAMKYFNRKLSPEQKDEILEKSKTYADVYTNTWEHMNGNSEKKIESEKAPNIPNVNGGRKKEVNNRSISEGMMSGDERLQKALGV